MSYTPQDIRYMVIYIGPGDVTSPFVNMVEPLNDVEAEAVTTWMLQGIPVEPSNTVGAEAVTPIIVSGDLVGTTNERCVPHATIAGKFFRRRCELRRSPASILLIVPWSECPAC